MVCVQVKIFTLDVSCRRHPRIKNACVYIALSSRDFTTEICMPVHMNMYNTVIHIKNSSMVCICVCVFMYAKGYIDTCVYVYMCVQVGIKHLIYLYSWVDVYVYTPM